MTFGMLEERVRVLVNDSVDGAYRFPSDDVWGYIMDGVRHLRRIHPSSRYDENTNLYDDEPELDAYSDVPADKRYEEALIDYAAYRIYQLDATDTTNMQLSENFLAKAEKLMQL